MKPTLLVLAAGMGSRYGGLKQLDAIGPSDETIMEYTVYDAMKAGFGKVVFVIRDNMEDEFRDQVLSRFEESVECELIFQDIDISDNFDVSVTERDKPWGTGHAVLVAEEAINEPFAMVNADDFYGREALQLMGNFLQNEADDSTYAMVSYALKHTLSDHGHVSRGVCTVKNGLLKNVEEHTQIEKKEQRIIYRDAYDNEIALDPDTPVSMNLWGMHPSVFVPLRKQFRTFLEEYGQEENAEFYLPSVISTLLNSGEIEVRVLSTEAEWYGVTYYDDKESVEEAVHSMIERGEYPSQLWKDYAG